MRYLSTLIAGLLFGAGIMISGMINPAKVLNFFDVAGSFDPSLAFVMGGALITAAIGYRIIFRSMPRPLFDTAFHLPAKQEIDKSLVIGSVVFGAGWGMAGFCPGGAIPAVGLGDPRTFVFLAAMASGLMAGRFYLSNRERASDIESTQA